MADEAVVFVGSKPIMNYVLATLTQLNEGTNKVVVKARGKAISRAVDVAEIVRNRFMPNVEVGEIKIGTEELESEQGRVVNVSTIEIELVKA